MSTNFIFPKPIDWNTFEDIVCDVFKRKFNSPNLQRYGRSGQRQLGVDIVGLTSEGLLGIQCKHHPVGNIQVSEIEDEISKAETFIPLLGHLEIVTSADRDVSVHNYVLRINEERVKQGKFSVSVKFWDELIDWLSEFPDLAYKHFTRYFPIQELEHIRVPGLGDANKITSSWPTTTESLKSSIASTIRGLHQVDPYTLTLGITSFPDASFTGVVDLEIQLSEYLSESNQEENFIKAGETLNAVKRLITDTRCSRDLVVYLQVRLSLALLFGWVFRRVTHFDLKVVSRNQMWATGNLLLVNSNLRDLLPKMIDEQSDEIVLVLNISRDLQASVNQFVNLWEPQPKAILGISLDGYYVNSASHALSIALEVSRRIKNLVDNWGVRKIHLFGAIPVALAVLITYHLNAICPITIYYLDESRTTFIRAGTLTNSF